MKPLHITKWKIAHALKPRWFEYGIYSYSLPFNMISIYAGYTFTHSLYKTIISAFVPQIIEYGFFRIIELGIIGPKSNGENILKRDITKSPKVLFHNARLKDELYNSLDKAITFIESQQQNDGSWKDFYSKHHGQSIDWVTAYVANHLIDAGVPKNSLKKTARFLVGRQKNGGWGYNEIAPQDADSTANVLEFLSNYKKNYKKEIAEGLQFLLAHQTENGGFKTYIEKSLRKSERFSEEASLEGWCSECADVTINSINALDKFEEYAFSKGKAKKYLDDLVQKNDIHGYWWESDIPIKLEALKLSDNSGEKILGFYKTQDYKMVSYTMAAFLYAIDNKSSKIKKSLAEQLIYSQNRDGSWKSGAILRFPHPSNKEPWNNPNMWRDTGNDHNRIYTTASIVTALSRYIINEF